MPHHPHVQWWKMLVEELIERRELDDRQPLFEPTPPHSAQSHHIGENEESAPVHRKRHEPCPPTNLIHLPRELRQLFILIIFDGDLESVERAQEAEVRLRLRRAHERPGRLVVPDLEPCLLGGIVRTRRGYRVDVEGIGGAAAPAEGLERGWHVVGVG